MLFWVQLTPLKQKAKMNRRPILTRKFTRHALAKHWASSHLQGLKVKSKRVIVTFVSAGHVIFLQSLKAASTS